jgi:Acetyltransferase (GNAT) domain
MRDSDCADMCAWVEDRRELGEPKTVIAIPSYRVTTRRQFLIRLMVMRSVPIRGADARLVHKVPNMDQKPGRGHSLSSRQRPISSWSVLVSASNPNSVGLRRQWRELLDASDDPFALYQSPEWFDHVRELEGITNASSFLAIRRDAHRGLVAVVPWFVTGERCHFPLVLGRCYWTRPIKMIKLVSGCLLVRPGGECFSSLFDAIHKRYPRWVVKIENVPVYGPFYYYLQSSEKINHRYFLYQQSGLERIHLIPLPETYEQFLERYSAKKRYNLRRQFRLLSERTGRNLNWREYKSNGDVPELHRSFVELLRQRGQLRSMNEGVAELPNFDSEYNSLARRNLLRSFVLKDGDRPICCILGYQSGKTFQLGNIAHDPEYAAFSPGVALLHLVIEYLINDKRTTSINLAYGDPKLDSRSTTIVLDYASYWLFPRTLRNRAVRACYHTFRGSVAALKGFKSARGRDPM